MDFSDAACALSTLHFTHILWPTFPASPPQSAWKPRPVSLNIPAGTQPVRIVLEGTPLLKGMLVLTGCRWVG